MSLPNRAFSLAVALTALASGSALAQKIYWTDHAADSVSRVNADGTGFQALVSVVEPESIALDMLNGYLYFGEGTADWFVRRANLDGSNIQPLYEANRVPASIAINPSDPLDQMLYVLISGPSDSIERIRESGADLEVLIAPADMLQPAGLALDLAHGRMYWSDWQEDAPSAPHPRHIRYANLDGSGLTDLVIPGLPADAEPNRLAIDPVEEKIYWNDLSFGNLQRCNLDGTALETLLTNRSPRAIAVDAINRKLYWSDSGIGLSGIWQADLDGSGALRIHTLPGSSRVSAMATEGSVPAACCDADNRTCVDQNTQDPCTGLNPTSSPGLACNQIACPPPTGKCCGPDSCLQTFEFECDQPGETWTEAAACVTAQLCEPTACCDVDEGTCTDNLTLAQCSDPREVWTPSATCAQVACPPPTGKCCSPGSCVSDTLELDCLQPDQQWVEGEACISSLHCVPATRAYAMLIATVLLAIAALALTGRQRSGPAQMR